MTKKNILTRSKKKKAEALFRDNQLVEAKRLYIQICQADRKDIEALNILGIINRRVGAFKEAENCCRQALVIKPGYAAAHHTLGAALQCQGNMAEALACYRKAIHLQPDFSDAHYYLGNALRESGELEEAAACYRKAIQLSPNFLEALSNLGAVLRNLGGFQEALEFLQRALRIRPDSVQILSNLGDLLIHLDQHTKALQHLQTAVKINPDFFDTRRLLGNTLRHLGRYDEALDNYQIALKLEPNNEPIIGAMAEVLEIRGEFDKCHELLRPFIEAGSTDPGILIIFSQLSRHFGQQEKAITLMEKSVQEGNLNIGCRIGIHFLLGKLYDDTHEYDRAFEHYRQANEASRMQNSEMTQQYDPDKKTQEFTVWRRECGLDFWAGLPRASNISERPVFIVGMPRSGTTLAEQILASHPAIFGAGELNEITQFSSSLSTTLGTDLAYPQCLKMATNHVLDTLAKSYLEHLSERHAEALCVVDKMPHNFLHLGLISLLFPRAHIIHMLRDPLDTCLSIYFQHFGATLPYTTDLAQLGAYYREYRKLMGHWKEVLDIQILEIEYEELVRDQENISKKMIEFCGLEWDARCLNFHETERDVNTPSYDQVRQPIYTKSVSRWKYYESHLGPLMSALEE